MGNVIDNPAQRWVTCAEAARLVVRHPWFDG
jgi:hypothetical protein